MKLFINKPIPEAGMQLLRNSDLEIILPEKELTEKERLEYCKNCDVILNVGSGIKYDKTFFENYPNVKAIALFSVGYDSVDIQEATQRKIPVGNTPDVLSLATSDTAFLLMQAVSRRISFNLEKVKNGDWKNGNFNPNADLGQELYGKTIGIYGMGRIGYEMAKKCKNAFDMKVIYHNRNPKPDLEKELNAKYVSFEELIQQSDVLSIHSNYTPNQAGLFNFSVFEKMKSNTIFINTARGGLHNEEDLYKALTTNKIWGAGLDVTNPEPMKSSNKLLDLSTVCVLPHVGSATIQARDGMAKRAAENIIAFSKGEKMPYLVNKELL